MKCIANVGVVFIALGLASACSGSGEAGDPSTRPGPSMGEEGAEEEGAEDVSDGVAPAQVTELHEFDVEGTHYTIIEVDGELLTTFSHQRHTPVPRVVSADGEQLTLLEMYLALQPDGVPDQRLLDDHAVQVEWLGRADASVHSASVELLTQVDKTLQDDCIVAAAGFSGGTFIAPHYTKSGTIGVLNGTFTSARASKPSGERGDMLLLACNYNANAQTETVQFAKKTGLGAFINQFSSSIVAGQTSGIIQNTGNGITRFNLRAQVTTFPNVPMILGVFAEARP